MSSTLIIAEAGVNHNGSLKIAKELAKTAKRCGADIVKFQTFIPKKMVSKQAQMAEYQKENIGQEESQESMLRKLALSNKEFLSLYNYCREIGIRFLSTPFDIESIFFLNPIQDIWKVPSGEITNYPYLVEIAKTGKKIILSTGMSTISEVDVALEVLKKNGAGEIILLHCTTNYPTPMQDVNLNAMLTLKEHCGCEIGYSDHTCGIEIPIAATAMGAKIIEKHFTLNRNMDGPDHKASLEPDELESMILAVRNIEKALGTGIKTPSESEKVNIPIARKSIVASKKIKAGDIFTEKNITTKRPGTGISPMLWDGILGKRAVRDFEEDELIEIVSRLDK